MLKASLGSARSAGTRFAIIVKACAVPKRSAARATPAGRYLPKETAAKAIKPRPFIVFDVYWIVCVSTQQPPASPARRPLTKTAM